MGLFGPVVPSSTRDHAIFGPRDQNDALDEGHCVLDSLHVVDFKGIRDLEVSLRPLTVFVGPNGSGKTTLLEAVYVVGMALRGNGDDPDDRFDAGRWERGKLFREGATGFSLHVSAGSETILFATSRAPGPSSLALHTRDGRRFELAPRSNGTPEAAEPERALVGLSHPRLVRAPRDRAHRRPRRGRVGRPHAAPRRPRAPDVLAVPPRAP